MKLHIEPAEKIFTRLAKKTGMILMALLSISLTAGAQSGLVINEFMADNTAFMDSSDGSYDDWIELYNAGNQTIELKGYYLTDKPANPAEWALPDISIAPGGYLLIWADDDLSDPGLHANFKLSKGGEFVGLYRIDGNTVAVDSLSFGSQATNASYGRYPDASSHWYAMGIATPGKANQLSAVVDESDFIFDDSRVHHYDLHFYTEHWADTLAWNYEHGELYLPARVTYQGITLDSIGVRYKGTSSYYMSRNTPKKPLKFKFNKFVKKNRLYGLKELNFSNCVLDPSFMREKISYDIARSYMPASRATYATISVDGVELGFYVQVEEVDEIFLGRYYTNASGNLYKAADEGTTLEYLGTDASLYAAGLELKTNEEINDWSGVINMLDKLNNTPAVDFRSTVSECLDLDLCCRLLAFNMSLTNLDSYTGSGRNFYLYDDPSSGQFKWLVWDLNESFGAHDYSWYPITLDIIHVPNLNERPMNRRILENEELKALYLNYIERLIAGPACTDSITAKVAKLQPLIDSYVQADPNKLYSYANFTANIQKSVTVGMGVIIPGLLDFSQKRNANLAVQLANYQAGVEQSSMTPKEFRLDQNYPNPFNPSTTVRYELPESGQVALSVYDMLGRKVTELLNARQDAGTHTANFEAGSLSVGVYFIRLHLVTDAGGSYSKSIKALMVK